MLTNYNGVNIQACTRYYVYYMSPNKYSETDIIRRVGFLIDNIYVKFGGHVYQQTVGIAMWVLIVPHWWQICYNVHMKLILYNIYKRVSSRSKKNPCFNLTFRYIDDVISLNNPKFNDCIDVIYPKELETTKPLPHISSFIIHNHLSPPHYIFSPCLIFIIMCTTRAE